MAVSSPRVVSRFSLDEIRRMAPLANRRALSDIERSRIRTDLIYHLSRHPLLREYLRYHQTGITGRVGHANTQPWQALGERLAVTLSFASAGTADAVDAGFRFAPFFLSDQTAEEMGLHMALLLLNAQVYLWQREIEHLVRSYPVPPHVVSHCAMPYPVIFFSYQAASKVLESDGGVLDGDFETNWMMMVSTTSGIQVLCDKTSVDGSEGVEFIGGYVGYRLKYPDDLPDGVGRHSANRVLQRLAFINSPYVSTDGHWAARQLRKEVERAGYGRMDDAVNTVNTVMLRRPDPAQQKKSTTASGGGKVWNHHWWVTAHNKAQWYPSEQAHHVIFIGEHIKGDRDKPLLEKVYVVNR